MSRARRTGWTLDQPGRCAYLFADPSPNFVGHELCGEEQEWFFPLLNDGRIHPTATGHKAMTDAIKDVLDDDGYQRFLLSPDEIVVFQVIVEHLQEFLDFITFWLGSDIIMSLESPSGRIITRDTAAPDVFHENGPGYEQFEITNPEPGTWAVTLFGADVEPEGEEVRLAVSQQAQPNQRPIAKIAWSVLEGTLSLDGSDSSDADGSIMSHDWYITTATDDIVYVGDHVEHSLSEVEPVVITLVVTDDDGLTDFAEVRVLPIDIKPNTDNNPLNLESVGVLPTALLSSSVFDATSIDTTALRMGPGQAEVAHPGGHFEDVNGDGLLDLLVHFDTPSIAADPSTTLLCVVGELSDGETFEACDHVTIVGNES